MRIIHFSDSHAGGPAEDFGAYLDKRWVGVFNYRFRRRFQHDQSLLGTAVSYILAEQPDIAICTGDITSTGQPNEFACALEVLAPLVASDIPLVYIPGNHDYYVNNKDCVEAMHNAMQILNRGRFSFTDMPFRFTLGACEFIIVNESWPSNLLASWGFMKKSSAKQISAWCDEPRTRPRILIGHYPLIEKHPLLRIRHRLFGQGEVLRQLREGMLDLSLCGHRHIPSAMLNERGRGEICAGSITRNACLAEIAYDPETDIFAYKKKVFQAEERL